MHDPRPHVLKEDDRTVLAGICCVVCGYVAAFSRPLCPVCGGEVKESRFGPEGTVWSSTVVRVPTPSRTPPYALAYVDLDEGPRILAHVHGQLGKLLHAGERIVLRGLTSDGDPEVEVLI